MKVETPQILWNSEGDKGKNAPLYSVAMQESGLVLGGGAAYSQVVATAGNTNTINLWKVSFAGAGADSATNSNSNTIFHKSTKPLTQIDYLTSLSRHELPVNTVAFSPNGLHLVTAGEAGNLVLWSVPVSKRGGGNGQHFWSSIQTEKDLTVRVISTHCEGVCDLSWSADSKRFVVGTIDSHVLIFEDKHHASNQHSPETQQKESDWQVAFRNGEHSSFVQGVSYDPLGVYIASMGSDRTVRVFPRKTPPKSKKKVLRPSNHSTSASGVRTVSPPPDHQRLVAQLLTDSKLEMGKTKRIQRRSVTVDDETGAQLKQRLFVDESTCESFFRRLCWTTDGLFLITPCALWHENHEDTAPTFSTYLFARHRFDEPYKVLPGLEKPSVVVRPNPVLFHMPDDPSVKAAGANDEDDAENGDSKENRRVPSTTNVLAYRSVFAVLTLDSVLIYDTHHTKPLAVARGLHYAGLTDCCWSQDGRHLMVCSTDGYISILSFDQEELGRVYTPPAPSPLSAATAVSSTTTSHHHHTTSAATTGNAMEDSKSEGLSFSSSMLPKLPLTEPLPPCEPGPAVVTAPPAKRSKKVRVTPTLVSPGTTTSNNHIATQTMTMTMTTKESANKRSQNDTEETEWVGDAVHKMSLDTAAAGSDEGGAPSQPPAKKKKRIQPTLLVSN